MNELPIDKQAQGEKALANAVALVTATSMRMLGNAASTTVDGQEMTADLISGIAAARIQQHLVNGRGQ
jgi:hypothetical protein